MFLVHTWFPPTQVEGQAIGELILDLHQSVRQLMVASFPVKTHDMKDLMVEYV